MKIKYFLGVMLFFISSCSQLSTRKDIKESIPGTYFKQSEGKFSKALDTLIISPYDPHAGTYIIERKTGFFRIVDGKIQPKQNKLEKIISGFSSNWVSI